MTNLSYTKKHIEICELSTTRIAADFLTFLPLLGLIINEQSILRQPQSIGYLQKNSASQKLKLLFKQLAYQGGLLGIFHRFKNHRNLTVAMFHRILPSTDSRYAGADPEWTMSPDTFEKCLIFFRKHYHIVSPNQVFSALQGESKLPSRSLLITFDDGWADTANYALPILNKFSISSLIFVAGAAMNQTRPFWEECIYSFLATHSKGIVELETRLKPYGINLVTSDSSVMNEQSIRDIISKLGHLDRSILETLADQLTKTKKQQAAMLSTEDIAMLIGSSHTIGGHGMTHQALTKVDNLDQELKNAQYTISEFLNNEPVKAMSFPHGAYSNKVINQCRSAGYQFLFSSDAFLNTLEATYSERSVIGRIHISEREIYDNSGKFKSALLATWMFLRPVNKYM